MQKLKNFIGAHPEFFTVLSLCVIFYIIFFHNIWAYALMDVDESRYVTMAKEMFQNKDFLTLYLNNEYFFEKPPLFFWSECLSFAVFGKINEFTARFPVAVYGTSCCFLVYIMGRKIISREYGAISALILATSLEFLILSKFAILDIVVSAFIGFSVCLGMVVYFCRESRKKYYWWLFYIFSGFAVMAKGLPGFIIPFGSMFLISLASQKVKEIFKPIYFIPGITLFLLITLPWHIIMFKMYNPIFWEEYFIKHHFARFLGSEVINREQPFYFYFITLLWGFFPWIVSCLSVWIKNIKDFIRNRNLYFTSNNYNTIQRFLLYNTIIVLFILLFFSLSGTKLITYILPIYISLSCLGGYVWWNYIEKKQDEKLINKTIYTLGSLLIIIGIGGIFTPLYLPEQLNIDISGAKAFCITAFIIAGICSIIFTKKRHYKTVFSVFVLLMAFYSAIATKKFFEIDYKFGQNDLMEFAEYAKENKLSLTTFSFGKKYSLLYYGEQDVIFGHKLKLKDLNKELKRKNNLIIIQNKDLQKVKNKKFDIIKRGRKYSLIEERGLIK